jgi:hypothetical protein
VRYPTAADAEAAVRDYTEFLGTRADGASRNGARLFILEDGDIEAVALTGEYIVGVWDADTSALDFIHAVEASMAGGE